MITLAPRVLIADSPKGKSSMNAVTGANASGENRMPDGPAMKSS
jgi:hypothetical protein